MTIEEKVYALLAAAAGVTALVPAARIRPPGNWQNLALPYVVHFPLAPDPTETHEGRQPLTGWTYQVSCFADLYSHARAVGIAVRDALEGYHDGVHFRWTDHIHLFEPDVGTAGIHQAVEQFDVFESLSSPL